MRITFQNSMTRRERLIKTVRGKDVDRPAVSFYELNGLDENTDDNDPFNIYSHPSWKPLITLTQKYTDRIVMRYVPFIPSSSSERDARIKRQTVINNGSRYTVQHIHTDKGVLTSRVRRDPDVNTEWTEEHLLKNTDDLRAYLTLPSFSTNCDVHTDGVIKAENAIGDSGIVMIDTPDPLCMAASLFDMATYTVIALTEPVLFHALLEYCADYVWAKTEAVARALPGRLWRIYGPEYATPPYLPPRLFEEYVCRYVTPMIKAIHRYGGFARVHCHGRVRDVLDYIIQMNADGIDPVEPPPQGDVELKYMRKNYGKNLVLFGNLEISEIMTMPTEKYEKKITQALAEGTHGEGRGFVLMPSACPYGREVSSLTLRNYEKIIELVYAWQ